MHTSTSGTATFPQIERQAERCVSPQVWRWARDGAAVALCALAFSAFRYVGAPSAVALVLSAGAVAADRPRFAFATILAAWALWAPEDTLALGAATAAVIAAAIYMPFRRMVLGLRPALAAVVIVVLAGNIDTAMSLSQVRQHIIAHRDTVRDLEAWRRPAAQLVEWSYLLSPMPTPTRLEAIAKLTFANLRRRDVICAQLESAERCRAEIATTAYVAEFGGRGVLIAPAYSGIRVVDAYDWTVVRRFDDVMWRNLSSDEVASEKKWAEHYLCGPGGFAERTQCDLVPQEADRKHIRFHR